MSSKKGWAIHKEVWQKMPREFQDIRWKLTKVTENS